MYTAKRHSSRTPLIVFDRDKHDNITMPGIPMGGGGVPNNTMPGELAAWVEEPHRIPLLLALSLYKNTLQEFQGYLLQPGSSDRIGIWYRDFDEQWVVGCRGTSLFASNSGSDLADDSKIAFGSYCDLSLVKEAMQAVESILDQDVDEDDIWIVGHSLGGAAALCVAAQFQLNCISFNGGASPTNPVVSGPGPYLATHYHIFGDLVSTHMSEGAARVVRIKTEKTHFGELYPHSSERILDKVPFRIVSATEEDEAYLAWAKNYKLSFSILGAWFSIGKYIADMKKYSIAKKAPIPNSQRAISMGLY
jgi:pimeloyl-ACP methyl ester carboxylesterase